MRRPRFQFSVRWLLGATAVVAVLCAATAALFGMLWADDEKIYESILLGLVTAVCMCGAICSIGYTLFIRRRWPKVQAEVLRYRLTRSDGEHGQPFFHPVFRFTTLDGQTVTGLSPWGSWRRPWPRGSRVTVRYCLSNPRRTEIECFANNWGIACTLVGIIVGAWAVIYGISW
jgi:magnesium-transporting ATPase (P-type)